jgi:type IV secretion system protein VirB10
VSSDNPEANVSTHDRSDPDMSTPTTPPAPDPNSPRAGAELTYASKLPPDHPGLNVERAAGRVLRRGPVIAAATVIAGAGALAVAVALRPKPVDPLRPSIEHAADPSTKNITVADAVQSASGNDTPIHAGPLELGPPVRDRASARQTSSPTAPSAQPGSTSPSPAAIQRQAQRQARLEDEFKAFGAPLQLSVDDPAAGEQPSPSSPFRPLVSTAGTADGIPGGAVSPGAATDPNMQQRKNDFLTRDGVNKSTYLTESALEPRSPYEIKAGTIIPTALITGIDSDLPGQIVGQVREHIYDTVSGDHLLIPQGSRLLATYDSMVGFGQERVLVCWNRLVRPDGISLTLDCMPGVDLAGYAGYADDVDHHWGRIITGVVLGSLLSATAQRSQGDVSGYQPTFPQVWAGGVAGGINQAAQNITQKNLQIQPTIKVRSGFSVNVLVTKDIVIPPFTINQGATP